MTTQENRTKLNDAIQKAAEIMWRHQQTLPGWLMPPYSPGNVYVIAQETQITVQYVLVRAHPDEPLVLLVPCDDHFLAGTPDERLIDEDVPFIARCGECFFIPEASLDKFTYVDKLQPRNLHSIRLKIHELATGKINGSVSQDCVDFDPNYESHMREIANLRVKLETAPDTNERAVTTQEAKDDL